MKDKLGSEDVIWDLTSLYKQSVFYCNPSAFLKSDFTFKQATAFATGTAQLTVSLSGLRQIKIPLPPLAEQRRIVAEVERCVSVSDKMEAIITESLLKAESLRQSILKKAFEGKLLNKKELEKAQNTSDWEPAEKLLEKIRQEKQIKENKYIQKFKDTPPKTHNLLYILEFIDLELPEDTYDFVFTLNRVSVLTRYPDNLQKMLEDYNKEKTNEILGKSKELLKWLKAK